LGPPFDGGRQLKEAEKLLFFFDIISLIWFLLEKLAGTDIARITKAQYFFLWIVDPSIPA
jgi:hypothetical protein